MSCIVETNFAICVPTKVLEEVIDENNLINFHRLNPQMFPDHVCGGYIEFNDECDDPAEAVYHDVFLETKDTIAPTQILAGLIKMFPEGDINGCVVTVNWILDFHVFDDHYDYSYPHHLVLHNEQYDYDVKFAQGLKEDKVLIDLLQEAIAPYSSVYVDTASRKREPEYVKLTDILNELSL